MNYQDLPIPFKVKAVESWQRDDRYHPLTCGNDSTHRPLHPFHRHSTNEFYLMCFDCQYKQENVPDCVLEKFFIDQKFVSKPQFFQFHVFEPNLANVVNAVESFKFFDIHYLNDRFFKITEGQDHVYYNVKDKMGTSLGMVFIGDYIVFNETEVTIYGPDKFNETFTKHY